VTKKLPVVFYLTHFEIFVIFLTQINDKLNDK
jgi:hypothetical protein